MRHLAIIPARSGSKRIPDKNIRNFLGKPVIAYSIQAAFESNIFDEVMVSTDSEEYAKIAREYGAKVPFLRSPGNSDDHAGTAEVALEVLSKYEEAGMHFDFVTVIYPVAPLIQANALQRAFEMLKGGADCSFPVLRYSYPIERSLVLDSGGFRMKWPENYSLRTQDCEPHFHDAGQFYCIPVSVLILTKRLITGRMDCIELEALDAQDVDHEVDWQLAEMKYLLRRKKA